MKHMKKNFSLLALAVLSLVGFGQSHSAGNFSGSLIDAARDGAADGLPEDGCAPHGCIVIGIRG